MSKSSWIIFVVVVVALFGGLVVWTRATNPSIDTSAIDTSSVLAASEASGGIADHVKGNVDSKAVIVEYGDFQCGGCAEISKVVKEFMAGEYAEKVALVYRNFNIPSFTNSRAASGTAEAAGLQGKYWEMHAKLFENQSSWSMLDANSRTDLFTSYAEDLGLDIDKFTSDLASTEVNKKITFDKSLGNKDGVSATPAFYINGKKLDDDIYNSFGNRDFEPLQKYLDEILGE